MLAHAAEQQQTLLRELERAEMRIQELEEEVTGGEAIIESHRAQHVSLRRRNQELQELSDASSIPKVHMFR
jgi:hypothetical protein